MNLLPRRRRNLIDGLRRWIRGGPFRLGGLFVLGRDCGPSGRLQFFYSPLDSGQALVEVHQCGIASTRRVSTDLGNQFISKKNDSRNGGKDEQESNKPRPWTLGGR